MEGPARIVHVDDVEPILSRGGDLRILLSPKTVGATCGILGVYRLPPGESLVEHAHPYGEEMFYITRGTCLATVDDQVQRLVAGQAVLVPKNVRHSLRNDGSEDLELVFANSPLAPRPEAGHVDMASPTP